ncbi:hypothetical protein ACQ4PT_071449 [Festuca glaucescens]
MAAPTQMAEPRSQPSTSPLLLSNYRQRQRPAPTPAQHVPPGIRAPQPRALPPHGVSLSIIPASDRWGNWTFLLAAAALGVWSDRPPAQVEVDDCPIEEVRLTVPITDDPTLPALTFRTWFLGIISCALLAFCNQFFSYRQNPLNISSLSVQIVVLPLGRLMAACLPPKVVGFKGTGWSFSLNPGPFNLKEHVLITIFANTGSSYVYAVGIVTIVKAFYHRDINPLAAMLLIQTTQLMGYGWAGLFRKFLVDSPYMWWPSNLVQVALFRALHEKEKRPKGGITRLQFFLVVLAASFAYYIVPNFLFPTISNISVVCLVWRNSVTAQQIGSGVYGLGVGSFGVDWATVAGFLGTPLSTPAFAIMNVMAGFFLVVYVLLPVAYWSNAYDAKRFPIISSHVFMANGSRYDVSQVLDPATFEFSQAGYDAAGQINRSIFFAFAYGLTFAALAATLSHVALFHGRSIWRQMKVSGQQTGDVHTRLMKKNYAVVPQWWFHVMLVLVLGLSIFTCEGFGKELQLPYWGVLLAAGLAFFFTLPIGIITATTNQQPLNVVAELIIGYLYPGRPLANVVFNIWLHQHVPGHHLPDGLQAGPLHEDPTAVHVRCPACGDRAGVIGLLQHFMVAAGEREQHLRPGEAASGEPMDVPRRRRLLQCVYHLGRGQPAAHLWAPWPLRQDELLPRRGTGAGARVGAVPGLPGKGWIRLVNMPVLLSATGAMPPARSVNYLIWGAVGLTFNHVVYRRYKAWWAHHNYVLSAALDAGVAFMGIASFAMLQSRGINGVNWWGLQVDDHCDLASCPTAPGVSVPGCPVQ